MNVVCPSPYPSFGVLVCSCFMWSFSAVSLGQGTRWLPDNRLWIPGLKTSQHWYGYLTALQYLKGGQPCTRQHLYVGVHVLQGGPQFCLEGVGVDLWSRGDMRIPWKTMTMAHGTRLTIGHVGVSELHNGKNAFFPQARTHICFPVEETFDKICLPASCLQFSIILPLPWFVHELRLLRNTQEPSLKRGQALQSHAGLLGKS